MSSRFDTLEQWLEYLEKLHPNTIDMGLGRVNQVAERLIDKNCFPDVITVTGTNGKGSTVMSIEAVALAHGKRVGTYMSPHLLRYNERVRINGVCVADEDLIESFEAIEAVRADVSLTYFEFGTLSAFWLFARANLDLVVLEVGLGGRLDAVNIMDPKAAVITSIALDHESWLGNTREQVCFEKAGIRRSGVPLICGDIDPPSNLMILCEESGTPLRLIARDFNVQVCAQRSLIESLSHPPKIGQEQIWYVPDNALLPANMACALEALSSVFEIDLHSAFDVLANLIIPGRRQCLQQSPNVFIDVGHNPHAAISLRKWIESRLKSDQGRVYGLVGMLSDKDYAGTLRELINAVDVWQPVSLSGPRGLNGEVLAKILEGEGACVLPFQNSPVAGLEKILEQTTDKDTIIGFGSFYTVADLLSHYARDTHGNKR